MWRHLFSLGTDDFFCTACLEIMLVSKSQAKVFEQSVFGFLVSAIRYEVFVRFYSHKSATRAHTSDGPLSYCRKLS